MKYVIASTVVTDEIRFADGETIKAAGGAGIYALCGCKLWCDDVLLATGVGADYQELFGPWFDQNHLSMEGLMVKDEKTPHNNIQYFEDGEREEIPLYGAGHYLRIETIPEDLKPYFQTAKGIYIFKNSKSSYWKKIIEYKQHSLSKVMWEIAADAAYPDNKEAVREIASKLDIFSINLTESRSLMAMEDLDGIIKEYQSWNIPLVFLRRGAKGSVMIAGESVVYVESEKNVHVVDPTGGGNSSSGAVLYGYTEGYSLEQCGRMGGIAAAMCLSQYGVPEVIGESAREEAYHRIRSINSN